jgi:hypothetical protein
MIGQVSFGPAISPASVTGAQIYRKKVVAAD